MVKVTEDVTRTDEGVDLKNRVEPIHGDTSVVIIAEPPEQDHVNNGTPTITGERLTEWVVVPEDWQVKTLGEIADVVMGQSPAGTSYNRSGNGIPLINGPTEFSDKHPVKIQWTSEPTKLSRKGDLLLCVRGSSTGRINISNDEYCIGRGIAAIRGKGDFNAVFITYVVESAIQDILAKTTGSTFPNVDGKSIRAVNVAFPPPLHEQKAIADALSAVDAKITALDALIAKKRDIKQGAMQELLTGKRRLPGFSGEWGTKQTEIGVIPEDWVVKKLGEIGTFRKGRNIPKSNLTKEGFPCVLYGEIYTIYDSVVSKLKSRISIEIAEKSTSIAYGDILFASSGETLEEIGKCFAYMGIEQAVAGGDLIIFTPDKHDSAFLGYLLNSSSIQQQKSNLGQGSSVIHLYTSNLSQIYIPLPPLREQKAIAEVLFEIDAEIVALETQRDKTINLKQGMMQELLTGRTRLV